MMMLRKVKYLLKHKLPYLILELLPIYISRKVLGRRFRVNTDLTTYKGITFKIANTTEELDGALKLIQDTYLHMGLTSDSQNLKRVLKYNLLPSTSVIIAKYDEEVIATLSIIQDSVLGLPIEEVADISDLRLFQKNIAEISGLVIAKGWRKNNKKIFAPLTMYGLKIAVESMAVDEVVLVTNFAGKIFYNNVLGSVKLIRSSSQYQSLNNAEAYPQKISVNKLKSSLEKMILSNGTSFKELFERYPWASISDLSYNDFNGIFTKERLSCYFEFYQNNIEVFKKTLTSDEIIHIQNVYNLDESLEVLCLKGIEKNNERMKTRYLLNLSLIEKGSECEFKILDLSLTGLKIRDVLNHSIPQEMTVTIKVRENLSIDMVICRAWQEKSVAGFYIKSVNESLWRNFIEELEDKVPHVEEYGKAA